MKLTLRNREYHIHSHGIEFEYHGDIVLWLWWWRRRGGKAYISYSFEGEYASLQELDADWRAYWQAVGKE